MSSFKGKLEYKTNAFIYLISSRINKHINRNSFPSVWKASVQDLGFYKRKKGQTHQRLMKARKHVNNCVFLSDTQTQRLRFINWSRGVWCLESQVTGWPLSDTDVNTHHSQAKGERSADALMNPGIVQPPNISFFISYEMQNEKLCRMFTLLFLLSLKANYC